MLVQLGPSVDRCRLNSLEQELGHSRLFNVDKVRLEHALWCFISFRSDLDDTSVWELGLSAPCKPGTYSVVLNKHSGLIRQLLVQIQVV